MENLTTKFLYYQNQFKVLHWHTTSYARHMAYGKIYDSISDLMDSFIEKYQGKYGRKYFGTDTIEIKDGKTVKINELVKEFDNFLQVEIPSELDESKDTDLLNIRDEMLGENSQLKYLLSLK